MDANAFVALLRTVNGKYLQVTLVGAEPRQFNVSRKWAPHTYPYYITHMIHTSEPFPF